MKLNVLDGGQLEIYRLRKLYAQNDGSPEGMRYAKVARDTILNMKGLTGKLALIGRAIRSSKKKSKQNSQWNGIYELLADSFDVIILNDDTRELERKLITLADKVDIFLNKWISAEDEIRWHVPLEDRDTLDPNDTSSRAWFQLHENELWDEIKLLTAELFLEKSKY